MNSIEKCFDIKRETKIIPEMREDFLRTQNSIFHSDFLFETPKMNKTIKNNDSKGFPSSKENESLTNSSLKFQEYKNKNGDNCSTEEICSEFLKTMENKGKEKDILKTCEEWWSSENKITNEKKFIKNSSCQMLNK